MLLSDGALGTMLQSKGLKPGECPELWNITHRSEVKEIAESYLQAGSDIISTNSFGGSRIKLSQYGLGERCAEINQAQLQYTVKLPETLIMLPVLLVPPGKCC